MKELEEEIKKYFQYIFLVQGMDAAMANILSTLFMELEEIPMEELAEKTGYSLASISSKIKFFEPIGIVKKIRKPGSKKIYLYMEKNFIRSMKKAMQIKQEAIIKHAKEKLPRIISEAKTRAITKEDKEKIKIVKDYYDQVIVFEQIITELMEKLNKLEKI